MVIPRLDQAPDVWPRFSPEAEFRILGESKQEGKYARARGGQQDTDVICSVYAMMQHPKRGLLLCCHSNIFPSLSPLAHHAASFGCENPWLVLGRAGLHKPPATALPQAKLQLSLRPPQGWWEGRYPKQSYTAACSGRSSSPCIRGWSRDPEVGVGEQTQSHFLSDSRILDQSPAVDSNKIPAS